MWGGSIKIGARPFWGRGMFVLVISNINIGFQKLLTLSFTSLLLMSEFIIEIKIFAFLCVHEMLIVV